MAKAKKVLFLSTGNSTRGQMAEGYLRTFVEEPIIAASVGISSEGRNPLAVDVMREVGIDITSQKPLSVSESFKEHFGYVITICDATRERFPIFPFALNLIRWSLEDPADAPGSYRAKRDIFRRVRDDIQLKVRSFVRDQLQHAPIPFRIAS